MATVVRMPSVLTGVTEAAIATWLVAVGQTVEVGTPLAEIETEKAVVEYASEVAGTVLELLAPAGAAVAIGDPIVAVGAPGESGRAPAPANSGPVNRERVVATERASTAADLTVELHPAGHGRRFISPLVRRLARERGIDLDGIEGTGPNGRVVRRDLERAAAAGPSAASAGHTGVHPPAPAGFDEVPVTPMRRAIARRVTESATTVPQFQLVADCRVERLMTARREIAEATSMRISVTDFVLKAVAGALRAVPEANATWGDTVIRRHRSVDIALAVAIDGGLVTPVVREADRLSVSEISRTVADLVERARARLLTQDELEGGAFAVSNLGMYGTQEFSAIINPPHGGILAVGAARQAPVVEDGALAVGTVLTVTLSADHRVMDGALAARLLAAIVGRIENPVLALA